MKKLNMGLIAALVVLALLVMTLAIALGSVLEAQGWYSDQINSLQSENSALKAATIAHTTAETTVAATVTWTEPTTEAPTDITGDETGDTGSATDTTGAPADKQLV